MKIIKNNVKFITGFILGAIIFGGGVYAATLIDSKDVTYTPSDNNFDVSNVESALNELYAKIATSTDELNSSNKVYYLGTSNTYNIKTLFPDIDYTTLTNNNFLVVTTGSCSKTPTNYCYGQTAETYTQKAYGASWSYNSNTGALSVTAAYTYDGGFYGTSMTSTCSLPFKVYLITGSIS